MARGRENLGFFKNVLRATLASVLVALSSIFIFALILKWTSLNSTVIKTINQFIKVIALFIGCFFSIKGEKGLVKGAVSGVSFSLVMLLVLSLIGGKSAFSGFFVLELIFGAIIGAISGILTVNVKKS